MDGTEAFINSKLDSHLKRVLMELTSTETNILFTTHKYYENNEF